MKRFLRAEWDRVAGYGFVLAGAVTLVFGFIGVRTAADVIDEISYLVTGGIGAIFLLGVGATLLLSADLHDDFRKLHRVETKLDDIHRALLERHPDLVADVPPVPEPAPAVSAAAVPAGVLAVRRYRRLGLAGGLVAAVLFAAGALVTANEASTDHLAGAVGLALSGAMLAAVVGGVMVSQLKGRLEHQMVAAVGPWLVDSERGALPAASPSGVWVVDGLTLYHRAGCRALDGRPAAVYDRVVLTAGLRPCGLCEPDTGG